MMLNRVSFFLALLALACASLLAGKITLNDGTVIEGEIKKTGGSYTVKTKDGALKLISAKDVASVDDGSAAPGAGSTTTGGAAAKPAAPGEVSDDYVKARTAADRSEQPLLATTIWQKYIDEHPGAADLDRAKDELKKWQEMVDKGAEKIKGKWVVGDDLKKLHEQVAGLLREYMELMTREQTLKGIAKLQEVIKIYPNCFEAHFELGFFYLVKGGNDQYDKAIASLEQASRLKPNSPEALSNLAIAYNFRKQYEKAVVTAYKAAQIEDSKPVVQNLINAISYAPPGMRQNNPKVRPIMEESSLLAARHGIGGASGQWTYMRPQQRPDGPGPGDQGPGAQARRGIVGSGTGFFLTADGYIMTNRHVAAAGDNLIIVMSDGSRKMAEKIHVDDKQDIAILKIKTESPTTFIKLAAYDTPPIGTDVTVMGFPLGAALGQHVKITRGVVTSVEDKPECDVIVDAQVNPGNSGGPMVDKHGNLLALVAMKTFADATVSSYGLGISTGRLRKYVDEQKAKLPFKLEMGAKGAAPLSTEEIAQQYTKATVMILIVAGELPEGLK